MLEVQQEIRKVEIYHYEPKKKCLVQNYKNYKGVTSYHLNPPLEYFLDLDINYRLKYKYFQKISAQSH